MELTEEDIKRFWSKINKREENECWLWTAGMVPSGYGMFWLKDCNERSHRVALFLKEGNPPPDKLWALHKCKQSRSCCNPNHLYWGDNDDNRLDIKKDETTPIGERHGLSKLTELQVREIRQKYIPRKFSLRKLATEYNVSKTTILYILNNKTWTHI